MTKTLENVRNKISSIDHQILELITKRVTLMQDVLVEKTALAKDNVVHIFDPKREAAVVRHLVSANQSALSDAAIADIFESIILACRQIQLDQSGLVEAFSISIQGDVGSYSEQACQLYCQNKSIDHAIHYAISSERVLRQVVSGESLYGLVALNNAHGGLVNETIQALSGSRYLIVDSVVLVVDHALLVLPDTLPDAIDAIYSHPQALKQCRDYLAANYPHASLQSWGDTALAAKDLAEGKLTPNAAVIAHANCAEANHLIVLDQSIQDLGRDNETLFLLIKGVHDG